MIDFRSRFGYTEMRLGRLRGSATRYLLVVSYTVPEGTEAPKSYVHAAHCLSDDGFAYQVGPIARDLQAKGSSALAAISLRVEDKAGEFDAFLSDAEGLRRRLKRRPTTLVPLAAGDINWLEFLSSFNKAHMKVGETLFGKKPDRLTDDDLDRIQEQRERAYAARVRELEKRGELDWADIADLKTPRRAPRTPEQQIERLKFFILKMWHFLSALGLHSAESGVPKADSYARNMEALVYPWRAIAERFGPPDLDAVSATVADKAGLPPSAYAARLRDAQHCMAKMLDYAHGDRGALAPAFKAFNRACPPRWFLYGIEGFSGERLFLFHLLLAAIRPVLLDRNLTYCCHNCLHLFSRQTESEAKWRGQVFCSKECRDRQGQRRREFRRDMEKEFPELRGERFSQDVFAAFFCTPDEDKQRFSETSRRVREAIEAARK